VAAATSPSWPCRASTSAFSNATWSAQAAFLKANLCGIALPHNTTLILSPHIRLEPHIPPQPSNSGIAKRNPSRIAHPHNSTLILNPQIPRFAARNSGAPIANAVMQPCTCYGSSIDCIWLSSGQSIVASPLFLCVVLGYLLALDCPLHCGCSVQVHGGGGGGRAGARHAGLWSVVGPVDWLGSCLMLSKRTSSDCPIRRRMYMCKTTNT